jgi:hypothetical protein
MNKGRRPLAAFLCFAVTSAIVAAQSSWQQHSAPAPPARYITAMAFDLARARCVLFGGRSATTYFADTWEWDGAAWTQRMPATSPAPRQGHSMVYDIRRQRVVMFGGVSQVAAFADTWEWDGNTWQQVQTAAAPSARQQFQMAYDFARGRTVLFSGASAGGDTWEYDGTNWVQRQPAVSPVARCCPAMAYDFARQRTVLFGGYAGSQRDDTWEWDGTQWTERMPSRKPPSRCCNSMVYEWSRSRVVMFGGGVGATQVDLNDVWEWDGDNWLERRPQAQPPPRRGFALAFDIPRSRTFLFGGGVGPGGTPVLGDTWGYLSGIVATHARFGAGCAGSAGTPLLAAAAGSLPWLGETFTLNLTSLPLSTSQSAFGILGASKTMWGSLPLPLGLGPIGMPGCDLWVSLDLALVLANRGGNASWNLNVPNDPSLQAASVYFQGGVLDPTANALGVVMSNAGESVLAVR